MIPKTIQHLKFCRIKKGTKKPFEKDWPNKPYSYEEISKFKNENYGILCGYEDLAVIDADKEELQLAIKTLLPNTFRVKTTNGHHNYFIIPELKQKIILEIGEEHLGEVQSHGTQVVGPNSLHPSGNKYEVLEDNEIATIDLKKLYSVIGNFIKEIKESENLAKLEVQLNSSIDDLDVVNIWGTLGLKDKKTEYYGEHPIHGSDSGMNFWINKSKNVWHCFRCNSGGGPLSAIAVKEGLIDCSQARAGSLRGSNAIKAIKIAREKYGLKDDYNPSMKELRNKLPQVTPGIKEEIQVLWDTDLQNWEEEDMEWIVEKLIPNRCVSILTGKRGTLKTFITLLLSYNIASGSKFLGKFETNKGKVIYLDKENGIHIMKNRTSMIKKGLDMENKIDVGFICFSNLKIDKPTDILQIKKIIDEHKPKLLVIDTYRRGISFDENDAGSVSALFVDILRPIVESYNMSILLIHHNRKGNRGEAVDEMDELRGSSDLANYVDIILKTERTGNNLILKQLKNRNAPEIKPIKISLEFDQDSLIKFNYEGEYKKKGKKEDCVDVLTLWFMTDKIKEFSPKDCEPLLLEKGISKSTLKNALSDLQNIGVIENLGYGRYKVNEQQILG